jgi:two-component system response regulator HydG
MAIEEMKIRPKVVAMSGGAAGIPAYMALHLARMKADGILMKPFSNDELIKMIQRLLGN